MNTRFILLALSGILVLGPTSLIMSTEVVPVNNSTVKVEKVVPVNNSDVKVEKFEQVKTTDVKPVPKPMDASKVDTMDRQTTDFQHTQDVHHVSPMDR